MTMRLSMSSLAGTARTLVAVGTGRLASMLATVRAGAPRRTVSTGSSSTAWAWSPSWGFAVADRPGAAAFAGFSGCLVGVSAFSTFVSVLGAGLAGAVAAFSCVRDDSERPPEGRCEPGRDLGAPVDSVTAAWVGPEAEAPLPFPALPPLPVAVVPRWSWSKKSHHTLSTLCGSFWYFSYISSTSHSLAPNPDLALSSDDSGTTDSASSALSGVSYPSRLDPGVAEPQGRSGIAPHGVASVTPCRCAEDLPGPVG